MLPKYTIPIYKILESSQHNELKKIVLFDNLFQILEFGWAENFFEPYYLKERGERTKKK